MRATDIEIGGEYAFAHFNGLEKIRVTQKGVRSSDWSQRADAVRFEHVAGHQHATDIARTRAIEPWSERHDKRLQREVEKVDRDERIRRVASRLGVPIISEYGSWVRMLDTDLFELAQRLGVETD